MQTIQTFTLFNGLQFDYPPDSAIGKALTRQGHFELKELILVQNLLQPGQVFFDVGANAGLFTLVAAKRVEPNGHVYAFEPSAREADLLRRNIEQNQLSNVTIIEAAVSNFCGTSDFVIAQDGALSSLKRTYHPMQVPEEIRQVPVVTLDQFIQEHQIHQVDFIKVDVEGGEKEVLMGAQTLVNAEIPPIFMCEFCDSTALGFQSSGLDLMHHILSQGFVAYDIELQADGGSVLKPATPKRQYVYENLVFIKNRVFV